MGARRSWASARGLVGAQPGEAHRGAQFPEFSFLLLGDAQRFAIPFLGGLRISLPKQQLALAPVEFRI
jgi:hypothetical protein